MATIETPFDLPLSQQREIQWSASGPDQVFPKIALYNWKPVTIQQAFPFVLHIQKRPTSEEAASKGKELTDEGVVQRLIIQVARCADIPLSHVQAIRTRNGAYLAFKKVEECEFLWIDWFRIGEAGQ